MRKGLVALVLVAAAAPFLANDRPLVAKVDGAWSFPAFETDAAVAAAAPGGGTWRDRWASMPATGGDDWIIMPPWPLSPHEVCAAALEGPSAEHPLGVDDVGRDVLARVLHGARTALRVGIATVDGKLWVCQGCGYIYDGSLGQWAENKRCPACGERRFALKTQAEMNIAIASLGITGLFVLALYALVKLA